MGRTVVVAYRPRPGQDDALLRAVAKHAQVLRAEGLITARDPWVMRARDGTIVEVFEWESAEAIARAHSNAAVHALWAEFNAACDYVPLGSLAECAQLFAEFESVPADALAHDDLDRGLSPGVS
jgi:quinol monooxygenase YgiN